MSDLLIGTGVLILCPETSKPQQVLCLLVRPGFPTLPLGLFFNFNRNHKSKRAEFARASALGAICCNISQQPQ
jgi:hypothetical protein